MPSVIVYTLARCSTCREATAWLRRRGIAFVERPVRETPPSLPELRQMLGHHGGNVRRLFNTSGIEYRALGMKDKLPGLAEPDALALLAANGSLVKRPFLLAAGVGLVGFDKETWARAFDSARR